jgi:hypothetical protein
MDKRSEIWLSDQKSKINEKGITIKWRCLFHLLEI